VARAHAGAVWARHDPVWRRGGGSGTGAAEGRGQQRGAGQGRLRRDVTCFGNMRGKDQGLVIFFTTALCATAGPLYHRTRLSALATMAMSASPLATRQRGLGASSFHRYAAL
jgi:hypothetical protein